MKDSCACGCGARVAPGSKYLRGHWSRSAENKERRKARRASFDPPNPSGLCLCGCGEKTAIATKTKAARGILAGHPVKYVLGHQNRSGAEAQRWKGGRVPDSNGYVRLHMPDHPNADTKGYVFEHRHIAEQELGRYLTRDEVVHHKNGDRADNRPENLQVLADHAAHRILHVTEQRRSP